MITPQSVYYPLYENRDKFIILITGGRGSGKSFNASTFIERLTFQAGHVILYSRYTMTSASISIIPEFTEKIEIDGSGKFFNATKTDIINRFSGSKILFRGIKTSSGNQTAKLKSIQGMTTFVCDEAEEWVSEADYDKIVLSIRQKGIQNRVIIIMNPCDVNHFIYKKYIEKTHKIVEFDGVPVQISTHPNVLHIHTSYLDNIENLGDEFLREAEQIKLEDEKKYAHIFMGQWADIAEGVIFKKIEIVEEIPEHVKKRGYGIDFGYSIDPTAIIDCGLIDNDLYLDEICYKTKMLTGEIITELKKNRHKTISESADPRLIQEIANAGILIYPVSKGPESVLAGIQKMLDLNIKVTKRSYNLLHEFRNYTWDKDKDGNYINKPIDKFNHCFSGDTFILTYNGTVQIKDIKTGDLVLTSKGYRTVNKLFNNGRKKILHIRLIFHNFVIEIKATPEHKFKTDKGWKELKELKSTDILYLSKYLTEKNIIYTKVKDIFQEQESDCTELSGNTTMGKYQKGIMFTIKTKIRQIIQSITSNFLSEKNTLAFMVKSRILKVLEKEWIMPENSPIYGMEAKRAKNGILNMESKHTKKELKKNLFVWFAGKNIFQINMGRNFVQTNASRNSVCFQGQTTKKGIANYAGQNLLSTNTTNRISAAKNVLHGMYVKLKRELDLMLSKRILFANIVEKDTWQYQQGETSTAAKNVCLNPKKKQRFAQFAEKNIRQVNTKNQDFAVLNVLENIILLGEEMKEVYDIEVDKTHEYFANGILVHNCIDAARYWVWGDVLGKIQSGQGYTYRDF